MRVENMKSARGNFVPNQIIVYDNEKTYFQSYDSIIVMIKNGITYLDNYYWDYSTTTGKYRNAFLGENIHTTREKIKKGDYILKDLN
jgi:hypothetical protein